MHSTPVSEGSNNFIYQNNFINNTKNANIDYQYPYPDAYQELKSEYSNVTANINGTAIVSWDKVNVGNYWSDYSGNGTYLIDQNNVDHHPLTQQVNISSITVTPSVPELPSLVGVPLLLSLFSVAAIVARRQVKKI